MPTSARCSPRRRPTTRRSAASFPVAARETDTDLSLTALDAANARLRRLLIELHTRVEDAGDTALDRAILALYVRMAEGRRLQLGG